MGIFEKRNRHAAADFQQNYVELPDPMNRCGKKVFIKKNEADRFGRLVKNIGKNFNLLYFYKQIVSLKNIGTMTGLVSKATVLSRILPLEGGAVRYAIWDGKVYIHSIEIQKDFQYKKGARNVPAGLYRVEQSEKKWKASDVDGAITDKNYVNTKNLAINGGCQDIQDAASYMPAFIKHGFGENALKSTYSLFFNPAQGMARSGFRALRDSRGLAGTQASKKLAEALMLTSEGQKDVQLTVHECGHALLKEALRIVCQNKKQLGNITVFYANPTQNLHGVDSLRSRSGMKLAAKPALINSASISQNIATGNFVSGPIVAARADGQNGPAHIINGVSFGVGAVGLGAIANAMTPIGAASWALSAAPFLLSSTGGMNKKVIENSGQAMQEGARSVKKLIWDPVHKMMVKA